MKYFILLFIANLLFCADGVIPEKPIDYNTTFFNDKKLIFFNWGAAGPSKVRTPERIENEYNNLRDFLESHEVANMMNKIKMDMDKKNISKIKKQLAIEAVLYENKPQVSRLDTNIVSGSKVIEIPKILYGVPQTMREVTRIGFFKDSDTRQRIYMEKMAKKSMVEGKLFFLVCLDWKSGKERDQAWKSMKQSVMPADGDEIALMYGVNKLPSIVEYTGEDKLTINEGIDYKFLLDGDHDEVQKTIDSWNPSVKKDGTNIDAMIKEIINVYESQNKDEHK